jgi:hypothetical protein
LSVASHQLPPSSSSVLLSKHNSTTISKKEFLDKVLFSDADLAQHATFLINLDSDMRRRGEYRSTEDMMIDYNSMNSKEMDAVFDDMIRKHNSYITRT